MNENISNHLYSHEKFRKQLEILMEKNKISTWQKFEQEIGMPGAAYRWKTGKDQPNPESLLKISKRFKVSIDWLLWGEETVSVVAEGWPSYEARPLAPMEADLLNEVMIKVEEVLKEGKKPLRPEQKARLLTRVYNDCAEDRIKPDSTMVKRYLWILEKE